MRTVNQPSALPTRKLTAATVAGAAHSIFGLFLRNMAPEWYDPEVMAATLPLVIFLAGYVIRDAPNA